MTKQADLTAYLFEGQAHPMSAALLAWMDSSARFTAFVETYRDKIRKKIRTNRDPESALDLRSELEAAYGLLNDRRLAVAYEPYASAKQRGPDFAVTYRANQVFNIEIARMRREGPFSDESPFSDAERIADEGRIPEEARFLRILLYKLGQMQPGMANLLAIHARAELAQSIDLGRILQAIKLRAEAKDPAFYAASRYPGPAAFYKDFLRLSGILLWSDSTQVWVNRQARPALDEKIMRVVAQALPGDLTPAEQ